MRCRRYCPGLAFTRLIRLKHGGWCAGDCRNSPQPAVPSGYSNHVVNPLAAALGYDEIRREDTVATREGPEDGGYSLHTSAGSVLRVWPLGSDTDLDTPLKRGTATRVSPLRRAGRVLRACGEYAGLVTNGEVAEIAAVRPRRTRQPFDDCLGGPGRLGVSGGRAGIVSSVIRLGIVPKEWPPPAKSLMPPECIRLRSRSRFALRHARLSRISCSA